VIYKIKDAYVHGCYLLYICSPSTLIQLDWCGNDVHVCGNQPERCQPGIPFWDGIFGARW